MLLLISAERTELGRLKGHTLGRNAVIAAVRMTQLLHTTNPEGVLLIGTGSSYGRDLALGEVCKARRIGLADSAAMMGLAYPPTLPPTLTCDPSLLSTLDIREADVLTVGGVSTDDLLASRLADGWQIEHLEAFGAAWACAELGVPFAAILGIANQAGAKAHSQWLTHRPRAEEAVRAVVGQLSWIEAST